MAEETNISKVEHLLGYFDYAVLLPYRNEPDKYEVETDHFVGRVRTNPGYYEQLEDSGGEQGPIDILFGFRTLKNGDLAVVAWLPDLFEKSESHVGRWRGFHLQNPEWTDGPDERFEMWVNRYIQGSWKIKAGPLNHVTNLVEAISSLTEEVVGRRLFKYSLPRTLGYPSAQNSHRYQDAHQILYGYVIDGLDKEAIALLANYMGESINVNSKRTVQALRNVLTGLNEDSPLWQAFDIVGAQRREAAHSVRSPAERMLAFEQFTEDLHLLANGLQDLLSHLEDLTGTTAKSALDRTSSKKMLPEIDRPAEPHFSIAQSEYIVGKTVERVEFGFRKEVEGLHQSEALIIHFTDGSILGLTTGSNVGSLPITNEGRAPSDFHVDFILSWVPPLEKVGKRLD